MCVRLHTFLSTGECVCVRSLTRARVCASAFVHVFVCSLASLERQSHRPMLHCFHRCHLRLSAGHAFCR